jgi:hypothetical protein
MQYILEILARSSEKNWEIEDTIESDTPIPIPGIGDEVMTSSGWAACVVSRHYWFTYVNRMPLVKVEIRCRRVTPLPAQVNPQTADDAVADSRSGAEGRSGAKRGRPS